MVANTVYKNGLYACYSKRKLAKLLSNKDLKVYTKEIRNPDYHFLNKLCGNPHNYFYVELLVMLNF